MTIEHTTDIFGNELRVGDTFAGAFTHGRSAVMRIGTVVGFGEKNSSYDPSGKADVMEVQWFSSDRTAKSWWLPESGTSKIELHQKRLIKIDLDSLQEPVV